VPTISEAGVAGYESLVWWGLLAPPQRPLDILNRLSSELTAVLRDPGIVKHLESQAAEPQITTPPEFRKFLASEVAKWDKVARQSGIAAE